jgi:hypothetical protein
MKMFESSYKQMNEKIKPDRELIEKTLNSIHNDLRENARRTSALKRRKKTLAIFACLLVVVAVFGVNLVLYFGGSFHPLPTEDINETIIDPSTSFNDKVVISDRLLASMSYPSLEFQVTYCDLAIYGEIVKMEPAVLPGGSGTVADEKLGSGGASTIDCIKYTIQIIDTLVGTSDSKTIVCCMLGDFGETMTKPEKPGKIVITLNYNPRGIYFPSQFEHSIFTIDESGKAYSYSNEVHLSEYDGKDVSTLIADIRDVARRVRK